MDYDKYINRLKQTAGENPYRDATAQSFRGSADIQQGEILSNIMARGGYSSGAIAGTQSKIEQTKQGMRTDAFNQAAAKDTARADEIQGGITQLEMQQDAYEEQKKAEEDAKKDAWLKTGLSIGGAVLGGVAGSIIPGAGTLAGASIGASLGEAVGGVVTDSPEAVMQAAPALIGGIAQQASSSKVKAMASTTQTFGTNNPEIASTLSDGELFIINNAMENGLNLSEIYQSIIAGRD